MKYLFFIPFSLFFIFGPSSSSPDPMIPTTSILENDSALPCFPKQFPIALQIIRDSLGNTVDMAAVNDEIDRLNDLFEPICFSFYIESTYIIENHSFDYIDQTNEYQNLSSLYNKVYRINLYLATQAQVNPLIYKGGQATFEGITQEPLLNPAIILRKELIGGNYHLAHLFGEYFGLNVTSFDGNGSELANGNNCGIAGDGFCDTPADPATSDEISNSSLEFFHTNCRFIYPIKDANDEFYNPDISNIMSYFVQCRCTFTNEQYEHMAETYINNQGNTW